MAKSDYEIAPIFHAMADPTRARVIELLSRGPAKVSDLAASFDMALPSFTQHLQVLEKQGLINSEKIGRVRICSLQPKILRLAQAWLRDLRKQHKRVKR